MEVRRKYDGITEWYAVVEGIYRHSAIKLFINTDNIWMNFKLSVAILKPGNSLERYQQLPGMKNCRQSSSIYVRFTFADVLYILKMEYNHLLLKRETIMSSNVYEAYNGACKYGSSSFRRMKQTAMTPPKSVNTIIRDTDRLEEP